MISHMRNSLFSGRKWVLLLPMLLPGCQTTPVREAPSGTEPDSVVELDENTDPRFVSRSRGGVIGRIRVDGQNVFLNNKPVIRRARLSNGARIHTGANSGARIELKAYRACQYYIEDFHTGKIYGNTDACGHNVVMGNATGQSTQMQTRYVMDAGEAVVTLIAGEMQLALLSNPQKHIKLSAFQEARVTPAGLVGPIPVSAQTIRERMRWRSKFKYDKPAQSQSPDGGAAAAAAAALIWDVFRHGNNQHDGSPSPQNDGSRPTPTGPTAPTGPASPRPPVVMVSVPNLRGKTVKAANTILFQRGLRVRVKPSGAGSDYWVVSQSPAAGKKVTKGSTVHLSVSAPIK